MRSRPETAHPPHDTSGEAEGERWAWSGCTCDPRGVSTRFHPSVETRAEQSEGTRALDQAGPSSRECWHPRTKASPRVSSRKYHQPVPALWGPWAVTSLQAQAPPDGRERFPVVAAESQSPRHPRPKPPDLCCMLPQPQQKGPCSCDGVRDVEMGDSSGPSRWAQSHRKHPC